MSLKTKSYRRTFSKIIHKALLVLSVHRAAYCQSMPICAEVHTAERERCQNFLDNQFFINIVENYLSIQTHRAHQKLVKRRKTKTLDRPRMLVELGDHLFRINIV